MWPLWALRPPPGGAVAPALLRALDLLAARCGARPHHALPLLQQVAPRPLRPAAAAAAVASPVRAASSGAAAAAASGFASGGDGAWASALGFAAAAWLAVAAGGVGAAALAEADPSAAVALREAQLHIDRTWAELTDDWARITAMRPPGDKPLAPPPRPAAALSPDGARLRVTVPLRPGADARAVVREVGSALQQLARGSSSYQQRRSSSLGGGSLGEGAGAGVFPGAHHRWTVEHTPAGGGARHTLTVQVSLPLEPAAARISPHIGGGGGDSGGGAAAAVPGGKAVNGGGGNGSEWMGAGRVVFEKEGELLPGERLALTRVMCAASLTFEEAGNRSAAPPPWASSPGLDPLTAIVDEAERAIASQITRLPGFSDLADFMEYVEARAAEMQAMFPLDDEADPGGGNGAAGPSLLGGGEAAGGAGGGADAAAGAEADAAEAAARRERRLVARRQQREEEAAARAAAAAAAAREAEEAEKAKRPWETAEAERAIRTLEGMGARVYVPGGKDDIDWGVLAGYEEQKRALEDCLLLPLQHAELYDSIAERTRASGKGSRPRAVLFEGPPGTGKTTSARVLSTQASIPLVYIPMEALMSKWFGESEGNLAKLFKSARSLGGCLVFLDELDSLATSRDTNMHEASRRILAVLLREIDGFEAGPSVVIGATNRKEDLDAALLSRFSFSVDFGLPDAPCRAAILGRYAKQLAEGERAALAAQAGGFSGRDLRDVCEQAERRWASKIIRKEAPPDSLPPLEEYLSAAAERAASKERRPAGACEGPAGGGGAGSARAGGWPSGLRM